MISVKVQNEIKKSIRARSARGFDFDQTRKTMISVSFKILHLSESLMVHALIRHCMSVASRTFSSDKKVQALASGYLDYLDNDVLIENVWNKELFQHSTTIAMELISHHDNSVITDLIPSELQLECQHLLTKSDPITSDQFDQWFAHSMDNYEIVAGLPNVATSLASAVSFLRDRLGSGCSIAGKALRYLVESNDVMPDELGLFGMADDIFVLELATQELGGFKTGENLLFEFEGYSSSIKGLLMEEDEKLVPLSLPTRLLMSSMKYLIDRDQKRMVFALPEVGPSGLLAILYLFFEAPEQVEAEFVFPEAGENIYFPVGTGYVRATYLGEESVASERFHVVAFDDAGKSKKYMRPDQHRNCVLTPRPNSRIFTDQEHLQQKPDVEVSALFEGVKQKKADMPFVIFITQKNRFLHFFNELCPFGERLSTIFQVFYHKKTGSVDVLGHGENKLNVFSDAEVARDFFMKNLDNQPTVICDVAELGQHFLEQVSDIYLSRAKSLIFFYADSEKNPLETCRQTEFVFCCHGSAYADFPAMRSTLQGNQSIGNFEKKLANSYLRPVIQRLGFDSNLVDRFLELSASVKQSSSLAGEAYIVSKIGLVSNATVGSLLPLEHHEMEIFERHIEELTNWLDMLDRDDADSLSQFLLKNLDALVNLPQERNLIETIRGHKVDAVFARSNPEVKKLEAYLTRFDLSDVDVCSLTALGMNSYNGDVLVPVMPMRNQMRFLCQTKFSDRLLLNVTALEERNFKRTVSSAVKWQNVLEIANRQTFKNTTTVKRLPPENNFDFAEVLREKLDEIDDDLLSSIKNSSQKNTDSSTNTTKDVALACVYQIADENKIVFLPPRANVICISDTKSQYIEKPVRKILDGDIVLLRSGGRGDPYDEICSLTNPEEFPETKKWAVRWRERLRKYTRSNNLDLVTLQKRLAEVGLERGVPTINGWLENSSTIAPAYPKESIQAIYDLPFSGYPESEVDQVLAAIQNVYLMRREAGNQLLEYLGQTNPSDLIGGEDIVIRLPTSEFVMRVVQLADSLGEIEIPTRNLWDVQELERIHHAS